MKNKKPLLMAIPVIAVFGVIAYSLGAKSNSHDTSVDVVEKPSSIEKAKIEPTPKSDYTTNGLFDPKECLRGGTHGFESTNAKDKGIDEELRDHPYSTTLYTMFQLVNAVEKLKAVKIDNKFCMCDTPFVTRTELFNENDKEHIGSLTFREKMKEMEPIDRQLLVVNDELSKLCSFEAQHGNNSTQ